MIQEFYIGYYRIKYDDQENNITYGIDYLQRDLDLESSKVFFEQAKELALASSFAAPVKFEDDDDRKFFLKHDANDNSFTLSTKKQ